jgi:3D-(3,5/4)-trihydroxycyclohexane-1,2-dione acylhydrolase (decyclizing)
MKPVSRYFDRIVSPSQLLTALPRAIAVLTDPAQCGPVTLALPQDVQAEAYDYPEAFFAPTLVRIRAPAPDPAELDVAAQLLRAAKAAGDRRWRRRPLQRRRRRALRAFAEAHRVPVVETQAGKSALPWDHPLQAGPVGVTGATSANTLARDADLVLAVGTRLSDFTTGSHSLFPQAKIVALNVNAFDALKWRATTVLGDATLALAALRSRLSGWASALPWQKKATREADAWRTQVSGIVGVRELEPRTLPYDGEVIGAVQALAPAFGRARHRRLRGGNAAGGAAQAVARGRARRSTTWSMGYSCMGYEIAGGIGVKMAHPTREVVVMVGDGSYLMLNSEIATSVMLGTKLVIVVLDNRGYGCIHRLQRACGGDGFNNLFDDCLQGSPGMPAIDFAAHARALGAHAEHAGSLGELEAALARAREADRTAVVVIDTDPLRTTEAGGWWWEVGVPEVSESDSVRAARVEYEHGKRLQRQ